MCFSEGCGVEPKWEFRDDGKEIWQGLNSRAAVAIGKDRLSAVDFSGTIFVETDSDDDFVGFVFSFQDNSNFYVVYSAKDSNVGNQGPWRIVRVASETGPSTALPPTTDTVPTPQFKQNPDTIARSLQPKNLINKYRSLPPKPAPPALTAPAAVAKKASGLVPDAAIAVAKDDLPYKFPPPTTPLPSKAPNIEPPVKPPPSKPFPLLHLFSSYISAPNTSPTSPPPPRGRGPPRSFAGAPSWICPGCRLHFLLQNANAGQVFFCTFVGKSGGWFNLISRFKF